MGDTGRFSSKKDQSALLKDTFRPPTGTEYVGLPNTDEVFIRSMRRGMVFGLVCGSLMTACLGVLVVCVIAIVR